MQNSYDYASIIEDIARRLHVEETGGVVHSIACAGKSSNLVSSIVAVKQLREYLQGLRKTFEFSYEMGGTLFEKEVYEATMNIPYGETRSYGFIASEIGRPKAARAVGNALNKNPLMLVVPCHRVVASDGIGGFGIGTSYKKALLELERTHR